jgi:hypothetical protein
MVPMKTFERILIVTTFCAILFGLASAVLAQQPPPPATSAQTVKVAWEQTATDMSSLAKWTLYWSDTATGTFAKLADIPYTGGAGPSFNSEQPLTVTGQPGQQVTKYFRMTAWSKNGKETGPSNTASGAFTIPFRDVTVPQSVTIQVNVEPL